MIIYIILLLVLLLSSYIFKPHRSVKGKRNFLILMFGLIFFVNAARSPEIGIDLTKYYAPHYAQFAQIPWTNLQSITISGDWELGFCIFCKLLTYISTNLQFFITVSSAIIVFPYGYFIYKNSEDIVFSTLFYITFNLMFSNMNTIRQALAVSIVITGFSYLKDKKYVKYTIFVVFAMLFHKSALIAILLLIIDIIRLTRVRMILLLIALGVVPVVYSLLFDYLLNIPFLSNSYAVYESGLHSIGYLNWNSLIQFLIPLVVFIGICVYLRPWRNIETNQSLPKKVIIKNGVLKVSKNRFYRSELSDSVVGYGVYLATICRFFVFFVFVVGRLSQYFIPFILIAYPRIINSIESYSVRRMAKLGMYCILFLFFFYIGFKSAGALYGTVPYRFYWD